jgi:acyl carrier protein
VTGAGPLLGGAQPEPVFGGGEHPPTLLAQLAGLLGEVTGEGPAWVAAITPAHRLDDDLLLDSIELAALDARLRQRYGDRVDLAGFVAGLDLDQLIALTVADVARYLEGAG